MLNLINSITPDKQLFFLADYMKSEFSHYKILQLDAGELCIQESFSCTGICLQKTTDVQVVPCRVGRGTNLQEF